MMPDVEADRDFRSVDLLACMHSRGTLRRLGRKASTCEVADEYFRQPRVEIAGKWLGESMAIPLSAVYHEI